MNVCVGAAIIFGALILFGVPWQTAVRYALLLACPIMMMGMMLLMNHGTGQSSSGCHHDHTSDSEATREPGSSTHPW